MAAKVKRGTKPKFPDRKSDGVVTKKGKDRKGMSKKEQRGMRKEMYAAAGMSDW